MRTHCSDGFATHSITAKLTQLKNLNIQDTRISGTLPQEYALLRNLLYLDLDNSSLTVRDHHKIAIHPPPPIVALLSVLCAISCTHPGQGDVPGWIFTMAPGAYVDLENLPNLTNCSFPGMRTRVVPAGTNPPTLLADIGLTIETERPLRLCDPYVEPDAQRHSTVIQTQPCAYC